MYCGSCGKIVAAVMALDADAVVVCESWNKAGTGDDSSSQIRRSRSAIESSGF
jgi:hypothetical protein